MSPVLGHKLGLIVLVVEEEAKWTGVKPEAADCAFYHLGGVQFADYSGYESDARDIRITKAVIIDPGFGSSAIRETVETALPGMTLINLGNEDRFDAADVGPFGNNLANRLPDTTYIEIAPASHFIFLATCKPGAVKMLEEFEDDPSCTDPEGADRSAIHTRLIDAIASGLDF